MRTPQGTVAGFPRPKLDFVPSLATVPVEDAQLVPPEPAPTARMATIIGLGSQVPAPFRTPSRLSRPDIQPPTFSRRPATSRPPPAGEETAHHPSTLRPPAAPDTEHVTVIRLPGTSGARFTQPPPRRPTPHPELHAAELERPRSDPAFQRPRSDPSPARAPSDPATSRPRSDPAFGRPPSDPSFPQTRSDAPTEPPPSDPPREREPTAQAAPTSDPPSDPPSHTSRSNRPDVGAVRAASPSSSSVGVDLALTPKLAGWKERRQRRLGASPIPPPLDSSQESAGAPPEEEKAWAPRHEDPPPPGRPASEERLRRHLAPGEPMASKRLAVYVALFVVVMTGATVGLTLLLL